MTGSGSFTSESDVGRFDVEARSVNQRFTKITVRTFGPVPQLDGRVDEQVRRGITRGHVTVVVRYHAPGGAGSTSRIDAEAFAATAARLTALAQEHDLGKLRIGDVLGFPGVVTDARASEDTDAVDAALDAALSGAVSELVASREREGASMAMEIERLLASMETAVASVEEHAAEVPAAYKQRLESRLAQLLEGSGTMVDEAQVARECALMADRADVREEIARLQAHVKHARELLAAGGPLGRRLDFLVQEMHRETNTIGSKANDLALSRGVMDLKSDVERLREQVQNLE